MPPPLPPVRPLTIDRTVEVMQGCAEGLVLAQIAYQKPGEDFVSERTIEPYALTVSGDNLIVDTWQSSPAIDEPSWRNFRVDRITAIKATPTSFRPRKTVTLHTGEYRDFRWEDDRPSGNPSPLTPVQVYAQDLTIALEDFNLSDEEQTSLMPRAKALPPEVLRAVHGRVYASILAEYCADGKLTNDELDRLEAMRIWLSELGFSP